MSQALSGFVNTSDLDDRLFASSSVRETSRSISFESIAPETASRHLAETRKDAAWQQCYRAKGEVSKFNCHTTRPPRLYEATRCIAEACWLMKDKNIGCLIAENHGNLCGILTDRDIALKVTGENKDPLTTMVDEVMTRDPVRISVNRNVRELVSLMHMQHVRRVPILDGLDSPIGMVTTDDLIALFGDEISKLGKMVAEEIDQRTP